MVFRPWILVLLAVTFLSGCGLFNRKIPAGVIMDKTPKDHMVEVKGLKYHYIEYPGSGKTVVLLHGFGASTYTWEETAALLNREGFHVYALDLKGFGWSDKPLDSRYDVSALMEDVDDWMTVMNIRKAVVVGNSMGGAITTLLSKHHPEKVDRMVLIDAGGYPMKLPFVIRLARLPLASFFSKLQFGPWMIRMNLKQVMFDKNKVTEDRVNAYYNRMCSENALNIQILTARSIDFSKHSLISDAAKNNKTKTLIIWGKNDAWIPLDTVGMKFREDLVNSTISIIPDCGHIPQEERPNETARLISDFTNDRPMKDDKS
jgi:pimeloyl-ACP methyl ester carboxylesterase